MKEIRFKRHALLIIVVSITILHFMLTSFAEYYIAIQIGSQTGQIVSEGLIEATERPKSSEKDVNEIYLNMKDKSSDVISRWKIPLLLTSLPIKPIINPLLNKIRKAWIYEPIVSKKISKDQFKTRGIIIQNIATGFNSFAFGLLIYLTLKIIFKKSRKDTTHAIHRQGK